MLAIDNFSGVLPALKRPGVNAPASDSLEAA